MRGNVEDQFACPRWRFIALLCCCSMALLCSCERPPSYYEMESFISEDAPIIYYHHRLSDDLVALAASPLGSRLETIQPEHLSAFISMDQTDTDSLNDLRRALSLIRTDPLWFNLFNNDVMVAFEPYKDMTAAGPKISAGSALIVLRPTTRMYLSGIGRALGVDKNKREEVPYGVHRIKRFQLDDQHTLALARAGNYLLLSFSEPLVRQALDRFAKRPSGVAVHPHFVELREQLTTPQAWCYVDGRLLWPMRQTGGVTAYVSSLLKTQRMIAATSSAERSVSFSMTKTLLRSSSSRIVRDLDSKYEAASPVYQRLGDDTVGFIWARHLHISPYIIGLFDADVDADSGLAALPLTKELLTLVGLNTDLFDQIENSEGLIAFKSFSDGYTIPLPHVLLAVGIDDETRWQETLDGIIATHDIPVLRSRLGTHQVISWGGVWSRADLQPAAALVDNYLLLASSRRQIEEFIVMKENDGLTTIAHQSGEQPVAEEGRQAQLRTYLDVSKFKAMVQPMVTWWIGSIFSLKDREMAGRVMMLNNTVVAPLVGMISWIEQVDGRVYQSDKKINIELTAHGTH
jgi:hypothetical protein